MTVNSEAYEFEEERTIVSIEYITKFVCVAVRTEPPSIEDKNQRKI